jgi:hypothetical protein
MTSGAWLSLLANAKKAVSSFRTNPGYVARAIDLLDASVERVETEIRGGV